MMKPKLNRRGCLVFALLALIVLAAVGWFAREAPPQREAERIPSTAIEGDQRALP